MLWPRGGIGSVYWTRHDAIVDMVCENHWSEAVVAAGFDPDQALNAELLDDHDLIEKIDKAIHDPALVRKVWRRLRLRKDGLRIIRVTVSVSSGWE